MFVSGLTYPLLTLVRRWIAVFTVVVMMSVLQECGPRVRPRGRQRCMYSHARTAVFFALIYLILQLYPHRAQENQRMTTVQGAKSAVRPREYSLGSILRAQEKKREDRGDRYP